MKPAPLTTTASAEVEGAHAAIAAGSRAGMRGVAAHSSLESVRTTGDLHVGAAARLERVAADGRVRSVCPASGQALPFVSASSRADASQPHHIEEHGNAA